MKLGNEEVKLGCVNLLDKVESLMDYGYSLREIYMSYIDTFVTIVK